MDSIVPHYACQADHQILEDKQKKGGPNLPLSFNVMAPHTGHSRNFFYANSGLALVDSHSCSKCLASDDYRAQHAVSALLEDLMPSP